MPHKELKTGELKWVTPLQLKPSKRGESLLLGPGFLSRLNALKHCVTTEKEIIKILRACNLGNLRKSMKYFKGG